MQLHGCDTDELEGPNSFLPYGQTRFIIDITKFKKKLQDRAVPANYVRCQTKDTYKVYRRDTGKITTIHQSEFVLKLEQASTTKKGENIPMNAGDKTIDQRATQ